MAELIWTNIRVKLGDLKPWAQNPKYSTKAQAQRIIDSFQKFGQVQTVAVGPNLEVYDGHQRLSALLTIHDRDYELDARQANRELSISERKEMVVTLHTAAVGSYDWEAIANGWASPEELQGWGMGQETLKGWNNDANNLKELLNSAVETQDAEPQVDRAAELLEKWQVKTGDLWQIGNHRLLCGDSTKREDVERVMGGEKADCTVTDPPYGVGVDYASFEDTEENVKDLMSKIMPFILENVPAAVVSGVASMWNYPRPAWVGTWVHPAAMNPGPWGFNGNNPILYYGKDPYLQAGKGSHPDSVVMASDREGVDGHPTPKPLKVWEWLIERMTIEKGKTVFEPFCGSGTTLVACENLGRKCRAIEISPAYVSVTLQRMSDAFPQLEIKRVPAV